MEIGEARIEDIEPAPKSRDDIPALLMGLQHLYRNEETREALFALPGGTCCSAGTCSIVSAGPRGPGRSRSRRIRTGVKR